MVSLALPCRRRVGFLCGVRGRFFDILILSRRPFWVARVECARFASFVIQVTSLRFLQFSVRFGAV